MIHSFNSNLLYVFLFRSTWWTDSSNSTIPQHVTCSSSKVHWESLYLWLYKGDDISHRVLVDILRCVGFDVCFNCVVGCAEAPPSAMLWLRSSILLALFRSNWSIMWMWWCCWGRNTDGRRMNVSGGDYGLWLLRCFRLKSF